jgi:hypothetical protein
VFLVEMPINTPAAALNDVGRWIRHRSSAVAPGMIKHIRS